MGSDDEKAKLLQVCVGNGQNMGNLVEYSKDSIVSKTILDKKTGTITLFAFDKGQKLSEHTSPYDAVVQVIDGCAQIIIDGQPKEILTGDIIIMPANIPHSVTANEQFKMLLTMIRA